MREICSWRVGGGEGGGRGGHIESNSFCLQENVGEGGIWKLIGGGGGRVVQAAYMHPIDSSFIMNEIFSLRKFPSMVNGMCVTAGLGIVGKIL